MVPLALGTQTAGSAPYVSLPQVHWQFICDGYGTCKRTLKAFEYDAYGNPVVEKDYGDYDGEGDEVTRVAGISPNTAAYIVNRAGYSETYSGIGTFGTLLSRITHSYDGQTSNTSPPLRGDVTKECAWLSTTGAYVCSQAEYDNYGNVTRTTDALVEPGPLGLLDAQPANTAAAAVMSASSAASSASPRSCSPIAAKPTTPAPRPCPSAATPRRALPLLL